MYCFVFQFFLLLIKKWFTDIFVRLLARLPATRPPLRQGAPCCAWAGNILLHANPSYSLIEQIDVLFLCCYLLSCIFFFSVCLCRMSFFSRPTQKTTLCERTWVSAADCRRKSDCRSGHSSLLQCWYAIVATVCSGSQRLVRTSAESGRRCWCGNVGCSLASCHPSPACWPSVPLYSHLSLSFLVSFSLVEGCSSGWGVRGKGRGGDAKSPSLAPLRIPKLFAEEEVEEESLLYSQPSWWSSGLLPKSFWFSSSSSFLHPQWLEGHSHLI